MWNCTATDKDAAYRLPEVQDVVIYQINPRVYAAENSFQAILPHLEEIKDLGCNIVWFMPIYPIGEEKSKNSPYSVKDYYGVNPEFGTLDDFKTLISEAHKIGLGVIVDWVPNHTAWDNPWTENEDWYTRDSLGNIIYPPDTDWTDVAELNFDNQEMRQAMISAMKYWVTEVGVDGFRCDAIDHVPDDFLKQCNDSLRAIPDRKLLLLAESSDKKHFRLGFDLNYGWEFAVQMRKVYREGEPASSLFTLNYEEYEGVPKGKMKMRFTTNHDEAAKHSPVEEWCSERGSMSAFATILFFPDVPLVYGSQETGYPDPVNFFQYTEIEWDDNPELRKEYKQLLTIHNEHGALRKGELIPYPDEHVLLFERKSKEGEYIIIINVRDAVMNIDLPAHIANGQFTNLYTDRYLSVNQTLRLQPYEYLILKRY